MSHWWVVFAIGLWLTNAIAGYVIGSWVHDTYLVGWMPTHVRWACGALLCVWVVGRRLRNYVKAKAEE